MTLIMEELEKIPNDELMKMLCKKYDIEQVSYDEMTPQYMGEYLKLVFKSLENIIKMAIRINDPTTAALAAIVIRSMEMGPKLHGHFTLTVTKMMQKFIEKNLK